VNDEALRSAKRALRADIRARRADLSPETAARASTAICTELLACEAYARAGSVLLYNALRGEVDLSAFIDAAHASGRTVVIPRVSDGGLVLHAWPVDPTTGRLVEVPGTGPFGIREPDRAWPVLEPERVALALVPGVAFDSAGGRLGRGGGYYDRLLARSPRPFAIGVCFGFQVVPAVPMEAHDVRVDAVVSERGWLRA
jgi:5-formyltetrahydrofolate cyclo-ligase